MTVSIEMGTDPAGKPAMLDLEELLATRLLVQGNSGSGKSHLLRRLLEESAAWVQQIVIDPEGDFVTLADHHGHIVVEAGDYDEEEIARIAAHVRERRASAVLSLEGVEVDGQLRCAAAFLNALFDAPRDHWYPALVVVDEAQLFAPAAAGEIGEEARRVSLAAMTNLMCRGRKRGLAGVIATQRLAKLAKNVAAEASNFLMGRTFLDIDMARAADLLGMDRRQAETIRDLARGQFLALGPALARRPVAIGIGPVRTAARSSSPKLLPLPTDMEIDAGELLADALRRPPAPPPPARVQRAVPAEDLVRRMSGPVLVPASPAPLHAELPSDEREAIIAAVFDDLVADEEATFRSPAVLYQDFLVRCRIRGLSDAGLDLAGFARRLAMARAGMTREELADADWAEALAIGDTLPEDMLGVFLLVAKAANAASDCPDDEALARIYGTHSIGRVRRLLGYMEAQGIFVARTDLIGRRTLSIPRLGWSTAPSGGNARALQRARES